METAALKESTRRLLEEPFLDGKDLDTKVRVLLKSEYLRRLGRYRHTDRVMAGKYGMEFDDFVAGRVVEQMGFTWEVESDAIAWETAVGGILTLERKLRDIHDTDTAQLQG